MIPTTSELRHLAAAVEVRSVGDKQYFVGRAVEYNQWSELLYNHFRERISPGAFDSSIRSGHDIYASVDHDMGRLLGRTSSGTLTLVPDERGIGVEVPIPDYSYAQDLQKAIARGDMRGMSFIFDVTDDKWETRDGVPHRTVTKAEIYEVSFVWFPAYEQTSTGLRGRLPVAWPVAGEKRAMERLYEGIGRDELEHCRARMRMAELED